MTCSMKIKKNLNFLFLRHVDPFVRMVKGFGDFDGSMWLGLEDIHMMTTNCDGGSAQMFVYLETFTLGESAYALYTTFSLGDANTNYILSICGLSGTAGQALTTGIQFFT